MLLFLEYPKCTTCQKAKKWLTEQGVEFEDRDIKLQNPTFAELSEWYGKSGLPLKRFFNTSGLLYKSMGLKDKLPAMTEEEQLKLLATDGMLVKRPLLIGENFVLTGFRAEKWADFQSAVFFLHIFCGFSNTKSDGGEVKMTNKELLYVEDALGHEQYFQTRCNEVMNQMQDADLKMCVQQMAQRHSQLFQSFYGLL